MPRREAPAGADRALVFRFELPPMAHDIYLWLVDSPATVYGIAKAIGATRSQTYVRQMLDRARRARPGAAHPRWLGDRPRRRVRRAHTGCGG